MPLRPFPTDTPDRETTWRRGVVRAVGGPVDMGYSYVVDFPDLGTEMAFSVGLFEVNDTVHCMWRNESALWQIMR